MGAMTKKNCEMQATHNSQMGYKLQLGYIYIYTTYLKKLFEFSFWGCFRLEGLKKFAALGGCTVAHSEKVIGIRQKITTKE